MILDVSGEPYSLQSSLSDNKKSRATIIQGDAKQVLSVLPDNTIQCVVTSPPYWGVRDYGVRGQIGAEKDLDIYINSLVDVFEQVRRVLKEDGVMWLNLGDVYSSGNRSYRTPDKKYPQRAMSVRPRTPNGLKPKDLIGLRWRLAFALQAQGWYLRTEVIWHKTNAMPESVRDRPSRNHEYMFLMSKSEKYSFYHTELDSGVCQKKTLHMERCYGASRLLRSQRSISRAFGRAMHPIIDQETGSGTGSILWYRHHGESQYKPGPQFRRY